ncbi:uncharacterized protein LOC117324808 [Pecten maximus]|uniref:uncharacterized protein LOC117324808 n=1 Tax=Pecten maximus TaxID=6579 RepID=UPI00145822E6|nr:uncharacterized protein LOC117324808 [Pecten maximus]
MDEAELNELKMLSSYQGSFKSKRLRKTLKDKCLVIGETTMYYGNFGSVQVMTPIPGSPNLDSEIENAITRPCSRKGSRMPLQSEQKVTSKKEKKLTSQRKKSKQRDENSISPKYDLPPLKAVPASVYNSRCPTRESMGREPCHFIPSSDNSLIGDENVFTSSDVWIPRPSFKPSQTKTMPKNTFTSESSSVKYGSLGKLIGSTNRIQASSSLVTASPDRVCLPSIPGATKSSESYHTLPPTAEYINIYKEDVQLPPLKTSTSSAAKRRVHGEHYKFTKNYQK